MNGVFGLPPSPAGLFHHSFLSTSCRKPGCRSRVPDLVSLRAKMDPADKRIADYAGENNVRKFREIVDKSRKA